MCNKHILKLQNKIKYTKYVNKDNIELKQYLIDLVILSSIYLKIPTSATEQGMNIVEGECK